MSLQISRALWSDFASVSITTRENVSHAKIMSKNVDMVRLVVSVFHVFRRCGNTKNSSVSVVEEEEARL